jgi:hypothetical protein
MKRHMTNEQLLDELKEMRQQLQLLDSCKQEIEFVQAKYERLLESAPDAILFVNRDARIILINAMPSGGTLTIASGKEVIQGTLYAAVKVSDTGEGIKDERVNKIFEPFFTKRVASKGVGLGLSLTKKFVEDHGGMISVEGGVGKFALIHGAEQDSSERHFATIETDEEQIKNRGRLLWLSTSSLNRGRISDAYHFVHGTPAPFVASNLARYAAGFVRPMNIVSMKSSKSNTRPSNFLTWLIGS